MDLSIIIPIYNTPVEKLERCIQSVYSIKNIVFELILVDDGSERFVGEYCSRVSSESHKCHYYHRDNGGVSSARNYGLSVAKGKYVMFVDSDDMLLSDALNVDLFKETHDLVLFDMVFAAGGKEKKIQYKQCNIGELTPETVVSDLLLNTLLGSPVCKLFSRNFISSAEIFFNKHLITGEDFDFNIQVLKNNPSICYIRKKLYIYDVQVTSGKNRVKKHGSDILKNEIYIYRLKSKIIDEFELSEKDTIRTVIQNYLIDAVFNYAIALCDNNMMDIIYDSEIVSEISQISFVRKKLDETTVKHYLLIHRKWWIISIISRLRDLYFKC